MSRQRRLAATIVLILLFVASTIAPVAADHGATHGIDSANMDLAVDPRVDFYRYANGGWLDRAEIPADEGLYGVFTELRRKVRVDLLTLLGELEASEALAEGSDQWKAVQVFAQGLDLATRNEQGIEPIQPFLDEIDAIMDLDDLHRYLEGSAFQGVPGLFPLYVIPDLNDASMNSARVSGPPLGLPNRDYYLENDPSFTALRPLYIEMNAGMLRHAGYSEEDAAAAAAAVYGLEVRLAELTLTREQQQDFSLFNNPLALSELAERYPMMDWAAYLEALGIEDVSILNVDEVAYLDALPGIVEETPLDVWKDLLKLQLFATFWPDLSEDVYQTGFDFNGRALGGLEQPRPLQERVLAALDLVYPDAIGQLYVAEHFPPEAKEQIETLVDELLVAFGDRLERLDWMSPETKALAREKLATFNVKVGYPDEWETYEDAELEDAYALSVLSGSNLAQRKQFAEAGKPVDRAKWSTPAQTVDAFYNPLLNDITFPAGILQPPFFDYLADPASNYGAIGMVIGHEITHGFDLQGSQFDAAGNLVNWWTDADRERFLALNERVADQYGAIEVLPDFFVNGQLTVTENVADMGGAQLAFDALGNYLEEQGEHIDSVLTGPAEPVAGATPRAGSTPLAGASPVSGADVGMGATPSVASPVAVATLTQQQRFFIAAASVWRSKTREEFLQTLILSDPHAPPEVRATQPIRNHDAFFEAFAIEPGDPMFLPPEERVVIW